MAFKTHLLNIRSLFNLINSQCKNHRLSHPMVFVVYINNKKIVRKITLLGNYYSVIF